jgi:hypothetical protein
VRIKIDRRDFQATSLFDGSISCRSSVTCFILGDRWKRAALSVPMGLSTRTRELLQPRELDLVFWKSA